MAANISNMIEQPLYAVIDLGSNSFHLLIVRQIDGNITVVEKIKRKVRLASGLDENNNLSNEAIARGLDCLILFAEYLKNISTNNICIVATATLRIAINRQQFIDAANKILPTPIKLLTGEQEAETIFLGATYSKNTHCKQLVLDIGGASTELIIGENSNAKKVSSLNLGCVSFRQKFFTDDTLTLENFNQAITKASHIILPISAEYKAIGWQNVVGSSGTMQALAEILYSRSLPITITFDFLEQVKQSLICCQHIDNICKNDDFNGLRADRIPVLASGLAILIALFNCLNIENLQLSTGALREGLLHKILTNTDIINPP